MRCSIRGDYQRDTARNAFRDVHRQWPGVDAVLCANDAMALGVLDAIAAHPSRGTPPHVVGVNAIPEAVAAIAAGRMLATADFDAMKMSEIATEAAIRHLRGETRSAGDHPAGAGGRCRQLRGLERAVRRAAEPAVGRDRRPETLTPAPGLSLTRRGAPLPGPRRRS